MENLNLVEILKNCSKGTKFYSPVFGEIEFIRIDEINDNNPIVIKWFINDSGYIEYLTKDGKFRGLGECIIFPSKEQRDWNKWQRPFVKGDIVATEYGGNIFILNELDINHNNHNYLGSCFIGYDFCANEILKEEHWDFDRHATEEEKQQLINTLKENGYEWDRDKKQLIKINNDALFDFKKALELLKEGKLVARKNWNGKGMFIFMRPSDELDETFIINEVKSLPNSYKRWVKNHPSKNSKVKFNSYLCMKAVNNEIVNGWLASHADMIANDWMEINPDINQII